MKNNQKYTRRIYYTPGLISLLLLPVLCIWHLNKIHALDKLRAFEINWWTKDWNKDALDQYPYKIAPPRNFFVINMTGDDEKDLAALETARFKIRQLIATQDTINGVRVHFEKNSKYWSLVGIFNICRKEKQKFCVPEGNNIWMFNFFPQLVKKMEVINYPPCGNTSINGTAYDRQIRKAEKAEENRKRYSLAETIKSFSWPGLLYVLLFLQAFAGIFKKLK